MVFAQAGYAADDGSGARNASPIARQGLATSLASAVYVHPTSAPVNVPRTVFFVDSRVPGCARQDYSFDASALSTQNLVKITFALTGQICGVAPISYPAYRAHTVTPSQPGKLIVRTTRDGQAESAEAAVTSGPAVHSQRNVNGMWFEGATNGSGISLHHSRTSDTVFGTWFMFHRDGNARWYTMQQAFWTGDGTSLEGVLVGVAGNCADALLVACPGGGNARTLPLGVYSPTTQYPAGTLVFDSTIAKFTFTSDTTAQAEVIDLAGNVLFSAQLSRIQF